MFKAVALPTELTRHCRTVYSIVPNFRGNRLQDSQLTRLSAEPDAF